MAERYDAKPDVKLAGFQSQFEASCVSSHIDGCDTTSLSVDDNIYIIWFNPPFCRLASINVGKYF